MKQYKCICLILVLYFLTSAICQENADTASEKNNKEDNTSEESFFRRLQRKSGELIRDLNPYMIQANTFMVSNLIQLHEAIKNKLHVPYPFDMLLFSLLGYILASILMSIFSKVIY
jgi:hypothetical protein